MKSANAWGHEEGREVYSKLLKSVEENAGKKIFRVSLKGVEATDATFPRESLMELAKRFRGDKGFCLYDVPDIDLLDNWSMAAEKKKQPIFVWDPDGYKLIGPQMNKGHEAIFELLLKRDSVKAIDVVMELGLGLSNASSKLKQLWEKGYILRNNELAESGGIEYVYYKIK